MGYYRSEKINLEKDKYTILDESKLGKEVVQKVQYIR